MSVIKFPEWERRRRDVSTYGENTKEIYTIAADLEKRGWELNLHSDLVPEWFAFVDYDEKKIWSSIPKANLMNSALHMIYVVAKHPAAGKKAVISCIDAREVCVGKTKIVDFDRILGDYVRLGAFADRNVVRPWSIGVDELKFLEPQQKHKSNLPLSNSELEAE